MSTQRRILHQVGQSLYEWDADKAATNLLKHGVSFEEAASAFDDPNALLLNDPDHSDEESRFLLLGWSAASRLVMVIHAERGLQIRLISARTAANKERRLYEKRKEN